MKKELKNTVAGENKYFYANMDTNVIASYVVHKMGWKNYKKMLKEIFNDKVGIENHVVMHQQQKTKRGLGCTIKLRPESNPSPTPFAKSRSEIK